jgi:hypothetical protein
MSKSLKITEKIDSKALVKTGLRRSLGLLILFATVTLTSCTELFSPFFNLL